MLSKPKGKTFVNYALAVVAPLIALLFRIGITRFAGGELPHYITFYPLVMIVALFAGMGPGLATTATSALVVFLWVLPPRGHPGSHGLADIIGIVLFTCIGTFMSAVGGRYRRNRDSLKESLATLEARVEERTSELKKAKDEWERTFDSVPDLIAILDNEQRIVRVNRAMAERMGCRPSECAGQSCYRAVHGLEAPPRYCPHILTIADGKEHHVEIHEERLGGDFVVTTTALTDVGGRRIGSVHVAHDITARKEAERRLKEFYDELERRVQRRTDELLVVKRLTDIGQLAATVAHELRNPLGVIQLAIENIRRQRIDGEMDKHLSRIEKKISESNLIIDNLSFYSRIRQPQFENVPLHKVLRECISSSQATYRGKGAIVELDLDSVRGVSIEADPVHLKEIFNNIMNNAYQALKEEGGKIEVAAPKTDGGVVTIVVKDNGVGISKEDLERVHEPFFSTKSKGTGLGLTICNELIGMHGGRMDIVSEVGVGTTVTLCLPVTRSERCEIGSS